VAINKSSTDKARSTHLSVLKEDGLITFKLCFEHTPEKIEKKYTYDLAFGYDSESATALATGILRMANELDEEKARRDRNPAVKVNGEDAIYMEDDLLYEPKLND